MPCQLHPEYTGEDVLDITFFGPSRSLGWCRASGFAEKRWGMGTVLPRAAHCRRNGAKSMPCLPHAYIISHCNMRIFGGFLMALPS